MDRIGWLAVLFLGGVISVAVVAMTVAILLTLRDFRTTLHEAHSTLAQARRLLARANTASRRLSTAAHRTAAFTDEMLRSLTGWASEVQRFFTPPHRHHGNGSTAEGVSTRHGTIRRDSE